MKKYIKPSFEISALKTKSMLMATSLPIGEGTVPGSSALSKPNVRDEDDEEEY